MKKKIELWVGKVYGVTGPRYHIGYNGWFPESGFASECAQFYVGDFERLFGFKLKAGEVRRIKKITTELEEAHE